MEFISFPQLPQAAIALNATTPNPGAASGYAVWSTSLSEILLWDGTKWSRPPGNAGANSIETYSVATYQNFSDFPTTGVATFALAKVVNGNDLFYWYGFGWRKIVAFTQDTTQDQNYFESAYFEIFIGPPLLNSSAGLNGTVLNGLKDIGNTAYEWVYETPTGMFPWVKTFHKYSGTAVPVSPRSNSFFSPIRQIGSYDGFVTTFSSVWYDELDQDEIEMDEVSVKIVCKTNGILTVYAKANPGPVHSGWLALVNRHN